MARRVPTGPPAAPAVQRIRIRYAKRGRLRFTSHRDFARAFERALRRAEVPMAYSAGFTPHPKISYVGAAPTGVASEAEYLEIGLVREVDVAELRAALDAALPAGLDIVEAVPAGPGSLADRMDASAWRIELPGVSDSAALAAITQFLARDEVGIERLTKSGRRVLDARAPVVLARVSTAPSQGGDQGHAIIDVVVRQVTPAVRPDDVVAALRAVAGLAPAAPPLAVRQAQGPLGAHDVIGDPLAADREQQAATPK
ncbi:MAG TPA: TIGR03936 family radical SAM-associated protein [Jatrophihabitans sp.]|jgi:radical SAM-linked protein|nr:TIGR03936 family radical SAM-associated protein [Jatrophihabitans sp.]